IAQAAEELCKDRPQSPLSNFTVDAVMYKTALVTGKKIDMALTNFGGIRVDSFAEGVIMLDDVESAFPFNNYLCYIALKGSDLREMLESIVAKGIQPVAGVKLVIEGSKLVSVEVGGQPLDDERVYGLATVDFLLDGGDDIYAARNAIELIQSDVVIKEAILSYLDKLTVGGTVPLSYPIDDRVIIKEI
ncbi:MAG: 5'-nucleotidase C-terminal domain-containing protein, partial [Bacteroidales bacterium]|nr:5'-nucleotidase C-terminal domain-containing protein [Bacteroidales bacterium]